MMLQLVGMRDILGKLGENLVAEDWRHEDCKKKKREKALYNSTYSSYELFSIT